MPFKRLRPVLAIAADLPLGRLLTSFRNKDRRTIPWIFSLFHALESQEDFDIHWITLSKAVSAPETIRMRNQTIHILPLGSMGRNILTAHFLTVRRIRKTLNDIQPDLLHVWGVEQAYALAGIAFRGKKLLSYQGALTAYCQRAPQAFLLHMQALWERMAVKHYDLITCESPWACDCVAEIAPHARLSCMEYGVEPSFYHLARKPSPEPSCLFAGTIYELKGISYLVETFTHPSLSHVQLFIAGNGALRERLEALSTPNIHWLGSISRAELQQHLHGVVPGASHPGGLLPQHREGGKSHGPSGNHHGRRRTNSICSGRRIRLYCPCPQQRRHQGGRAETFRQPG